jgi:hypothetical protein
MKSRFYISIVITFTVFAFIFSSCSKYEEGPAISFRKPEKRISGTWQLSFTKYNGAVCDPSLIQWIRPRLDSSLFLMMGVSCDSAKILSAIATLEEDGDGRFDFVMGNGAVWSMETEFFSWSFDAKKKNINMHYRDQNLTLEVVRLSNKEMNLIYRETGDGSMNTSDVEFLKYNPEESSE